MSTKSNITEEEFGKLLRSWKQGHRESPAKVLGRDLSSPVCMYGRDTGEVAFPAAPCRGNRIICQHPENAGFVSYRKACNPGMCKFFEQEK